MSSDRMRNELILYSRPQFLLPGNTCQQYKADIIAVNFEGPREFDVQVTVHRDKFL